MSSLSTMTVAQLAELSNAPVVHPTGERKSKAYRYHTYGINACTQRKLLPDGVEEKGRTQV